MAIPDRILLYLRDHPQGADDGEIATALSLKRRQQANAECKDLAQRGLVVREYFHGKVRNRLADGALPPPPPEGDTARWDKPWAWEGNVRSVAIQHLAALGFSASQPGEAGEPGDALDLVSEGGQRLRVAARGYPPETSHSRAAQARQYFANAVLDLVLWRGESGDVTVALALPDHVGYRQLATGSAWLFQALGATIYWAHAEGVVTESHYGPKGDTART
jgi:hypothetical protein